MPSLINRTTKYESMTIANGAALSDAFDMRDYAGGIVYMPAAWTAASIGFQIANESGGTYYPLYDEDAALVQIASPAVDNAYTIPTGLFSARFVKLWSQDGAASGTNQGAARTIIIELKS
jgi:hypothetical protein